MSQHEISLDDQGVAVILQDARDHSATSIIVAILRESVSVVPDPTDELFVAKLEKACADTNVSCNDVIIVTSESYYSFLEAGRLEVNETDSDH